MTPPLKFNFKGFGSTFKKGGTSTSTYHFSKKWCKSTFEKSRTKGFGSTFLKGGKKKIEIFFWH
jgi:hypothetical protein